MSENSVQQYRPKLKLEYRLSNANNKDREILPNTCALLQSYPNPFNRTCTIPFNLSIQARVTLTIYNICGQGVKDLIVGKTLAAGYYKTSWDGIDSRGQSASSGLYFYRLSADSYQETKKMVFMK